jgi:hypothetical protein
MRDMRERFGQWENRKIYDRNYSESRIPIVPSAILETMSHQNFGDMRYGQDPNFRFAYARSVYKTLLRYINSRHDRKSIVQPLPPDNFHIEFTSKQGEVKLSWQGIIEAQEPSSAPTGYVLYMAQDDGDYDNGTLLRGTSCHVRLMPNSIYRFRITATNDGGQSFPTEELVACYNPTDSPHRPSPSRGKASTSGKMLVSPTAPPPDGWATSRTSTPSGWASRTPQDWDSQLPTCRECLLPAMTSTIPEPMRKPSPPPPSTAS